MNTGCGGVAFGPGHRACLVEPPPAWGRFCPSHTPRYHWGMEAGEAQLGRGPPCCCPVGLGDGGTATPPSSCPHLCSNSDLQLAAPPPEHTVVFLLRVLPETPRETFALWQMTAEDFQPVLGVLLDGQSGGRVVGPGLWVLRRSVARPGRGRPRQRVLAPTLSERQELLAGATSTAWAPEAWGAFACCPPVGLPRSAWEVSRAPHPSPAAGRKSLTYFNHDPRATLQEVTFDLPEVRRIFFGSFHKVLEGSSKTGVHLPQDAPPLPKFWSRSPPTGPTRCACLPMAGCPAHTVALPAPPPLSPASFGLSEPPPRSPLCDRCLHLAQRATQPFLGPTDPWEGSATGVIWSAL